MHRINGGIFPPVPTPFDGDGELALDKLVANISRANSHPMQGYVLLGSNGEFVLLSEREKLALLEAARSAIPADRALIAGTGCQSTAGTLDLTRQAAARGADAALIVTPHYYRGRMTREALVNHYFTIADGSPIPLIVYNIPACTGIDMSADTVGELSAHPNIIGLKDSSGNIVTMAAVLRTVKPDFQVIAGSASFLLPALALGAVGGILALANIAPEQCLAIHDHFLSGNLGEARAIQLRMAPVNDAITRDWGIAALKAAMDMLELYGGPVRSPLLPLPAGQRAALRGILISAGITVTAE